MTYTPQTTPEHRAQALPEAVDILRSLARPMLADSMETAFADLAAAEERIAELQRERLTASSPLLAVLDDLAAAEAERDRWRDIVSAMANVLEIPRSESGPCDDPRAYEREINGILHLLNETETEKRAHSEARWKAEAERDSARTEAERLRAEAHR